MYVTKNNNKARIAATETEENNMEFVYFHNIIYSLSARILHRAPPPPPAPSGPKFSNSENCCGSENAMPPKIFWVTEAILGQKTCFFFKKHILKKIIINHTIFLIFRYVFYRY